MNSRLALLLLCLGILLSVMGPATPVLAASNRPMFVDMYEDGSYTLGVIVASTEDVKGWRADRLDRLDFAASLSRSFSGLGYRRILKTFESGTWDLADLLIEVSIAKVDSPSWGLHPWVTVVANVSYKTGSGLVADKKVEVLQKKLEKYQWGTASARQLETLAVVMDDVAEAIVVQAQKVVGDLRARAQAEQKVDVADTWFGYWRDPPGTYKVNVETKRSSGNQGLAAKGGRLQLINTRSGSALTEIFLDRFFGITTETSGQKRTDGTLTRYRAFKASRREPEFGAVVRDALAAEGIVAAEGDVQFVLEFDESEETTNAVPVCPDWCEPAARWAMKVVTVRLVTPPPGRQELWSGTVRGPLGAYRSNPVAFLQPLVSRIGQDYKRDVKVDSRAGGANTKR